MTNLEFKGLMELKKVFIKSAIELPNNGEYEAYDLEEFKQIKFSKERIDFMQIFTEFCEYCNISIDNVQGVI